MKNTLQLIVIGVFFFACTVTYAAQGDISIEVASPTAETGATFEAEVSIDAGAAALGAYDFTLTYDSSVVNIASLAGGNSAAFSASPIANPNTFATGSTSFNGVNATSLDQPTGVVSVAVVTFLVVGAAGSESSLGIQVGAVGDTSAQMFTPNVFSATVEIVSSPQDPPPNDDFTNAGNLGNGTTASATGTNVGATSELDGRYASVWWTWTAPGNICINNTVSIDTFGSNFDTFLAVFTGSSVSGLSAVAQNDNAPGTNRSRVTFTAAPNQVYRILVDGYQPGIEGNITLSLSTECESEPPVSGWIGGGTKSDISVSQVPGRQGRTLLGYTITDAGVAVSLTADAVIAPDSITVDANGARWDGDLRWQPAEDGKHGWVIVPATAIEKDGRVTVVDVSAQTISGEPIFAQAEFKGSYHGLTNAKSSNAQMHPALGLRPFPTELGRPVSAGYTLWPNRVYEIPARVSFPIDQPANANQLKLFYHDEFFGWIPADRVRGLLTDEAPRFVTTDDGVYVEFDAHFGEAFMVAAVSYQLDAGLLSVDVVGAALDRPRRVAAGSSLAFIALVSILMLRSRRREPSV